MPPITQPVTVSAVAENPDSPTFSQSLRTGQTGRRSFQVPWASVGKFCAQMLGGPSAGGLMYYPQTLPNYPKCYAESVDVRPWAGQKMQGAGMDALPTWAKVDVLFSTRRMITNAAGYFIEEQFEDASEFLTLPNTHLTYVDGVAESGAILQLPSDLQIGFLSHYVLWTYRIKQLPTVPSNFFSLSGKVNVAAVTSLTTGLQFPAETVLYHKPQLSETVNADGDPAWDVSLALLLKPVSHNLLPINVGGQGTIIWKPVYSDAGASTIWKRYPTADFAAVVV